MGKAKKRILHLGKNDRFEQLSREDVTAQVVELLKTGDREAYGLVTLFGLSAEELLEAGADYETVVGIRSLLK